MSKRTLHLHGKQYDVHVGKLRSSIREVGTNNKVTVTNEELTGNSIYVHYDSGRYRYFGGAVTPRVLARWLLRRGNCV